jgi:hypothetical protein
MARSVQQAASRGIKRSTLEAGDIGYGRHVVDINTMLQPEDGTGDQRSR